MRADQRDDVTIEAKIPCAACGCEPKSSANVWGQHLCYPCIAKWNVDFPSDERWYESHPEDAVRFAAKKSLTAQWVDARRRMTA
jgi:hypothetical protein